MVIEAKEREIPAEAGLYMLVAQAIRASELFLNTRYPSYMTNVIYDGIRAEKENVVLIGMPSSGKSTVGRLLAEKLGEEFIDTDELITEKIKMPIKDFFALHGEEKFREVEAEVIREIAGRGGLVIATGGGAILRRENLVNLRHNGNILFIDRPLNLLIPTDSRPLSSDRMALENLYMNYDGNKPVIYGDKQLNPNALSVLKTDAPYVADKLYTLKTQKWNEALTYLGISNVNITKRERLITDEVTRNQGGTIASRYSRLESRREACKKINAMFGLNIDCNYREDYEEIVDAQKSDSEGVNEPNE